MGRLLIPSRRKPTWSDAMKVKRGRGHNSLAPNLWERLQFMVDGLQGGGGKWFDLSGFSNHGTLVNGPTWVTTEKGWALDFDGNDDVVNIGLQSYAATEGTILCWAKSDLSSTPNYRTCFGRNQSGNYAGDIFFLLQQGVPDKMRFGIQNGVTSHTVDALAGGLPTDWTQFVGTWNASQVEFFVDAVSQGTASGTALPAHPSRSWAIGSESPTPNSNDWDGQIFQAAIWNRVLFPSEIQQLHERPNDMLTPRPTQVAVRFEKPVVASRTIYIPSRRKPTWSDAMKVKRGRGHNSLNPGAWDGLQLLVHGVQGGGESWFDLSGFGNTGTLTNMDPATDWVTTEMGRALDFNGGYVRRDSFSAGPDQITVAAWVISDITTTYRTAVSISSSGFNTTKDWVLGHGSSVATYRFAIHDGSIQSAQSGTGFVTGEPVFLCGTYDGTTLRLFVNGRETASDTATTTLDNPTKSLNVGDRGNGNQPWDGRIGDVRIWNRALFPSEIQHLHDRPNDMLTPRSTQVAVSAPVAPVAAVAASFPACTW